MSRSLKRRGGFTYHFSEKNELILQKYFAVKNYRTQAQNVGLANSYRQQMQRFDVEQFDLGRQNK